MKSRKDKYKEMKMNKKEKFIIFLATCLGIKIFKKYWPYRGSYWNETHMNKNDPIELRSLIAETKKLVNTHVQSMFGENILLIGILLFGGDLFWNTIAMLIILNLMHLYAIMAQHYNRILAQRQLDQLKKDDFSENQNVDFVKNKEIGENLRKYNKNEEIIITSIFSDYYHLQIRDYTRLIGPPLKDLDKILQLRSFYYDKIKDSSLEILEFFHIYRESELYLEFLNS